MQQHLQIGGAVFTKKVYANISDAVIMSSNYVNGKHSVFVKQRLQTNIFAVIVALIAAALFAVLISVSAHAVTSTNNNLNTLKISPVRSDLSIEPGKSGSVTIQVTNLTKLPMTIQSIENDFIAGDERGTPALILDADKYAPTHSLKRFMVPIKNVTIEPGKTADIKLTIKVPADAQPGGYYGAVRFAPVAGDGATSVNLNASAASLVLLTVPGDAIEKLSLTEFSIMQGSKIDTVFQSANDIRASFRFQNLGSVQLGPFGKITVKQGDKAVYSYDFNIDTPREMVLPDSARRWDVPFKNIGSFGEYTVTATFTYGKNNETLNVTKSFWVIPWTVIIGAVVGLLALIGLVVGIWMFLKSYKRKILHSQSRRGGYRR